MWFLPSQTAIKLLISAEGQNCKVAIWTLDTLNVPILKIYPFCKKEVFFPETDLLFLIILVNARDACEFYLWDTYRILFYPEKYSKVAQKTSILVSKATTLFCHPRRKKQNFFVTSFANSNQYKVKVLF